MTAVSPQMIGGQLPGKTVAAGLLDLLETEGVEHVFGVPGGALLALLEELKSRPSITYHLCRHETAAAYMADGYHRSTGRLGVVMVTSGPGATNTLTGAMNADSAGSPLLVITGEVSTSYFGRGYLQEGVDADLDVAGVYRSAMAYSEIIGAPADFLELACTALRVAWARPHRAVHLSIPDDIAASPLPGPGAPATTGSYRARTRYVDADGVDQAVEVLASSPRPLLMLGNGCRRSLSHPQVLASLIAAVEHLGVPVVTDADAKGIFPESHELSLRNFGAAACEWPKYWLYSPEGERVEDLVVIGSDLGSLATANWSPLLEPPGGIVQIHDDPAVIGRAYPLRLGVVSELGEALDRFVGHAGQVPVDPTVVARRRAAVAWVKEACSPFADPAARRDSAAPIKPAALVAMVGDRLGRDGRVYVDAGNCVGWCLNYLVIDPPAEVHLSLAMGPMGFAMGAAPGAKLAEPARTCMAVVGDGAFMMHLGEVATAAQYGIGVVWVVLADHDLAMVSQGMAHFTGDTGFDGYYSLEWSDLAQAARGLGAQAYDAATVDALAAALDAALAGAEAGVPQVVVAAIDTYQVPPYYPPPYPPPPYPPPAGPGS